MADPLDGLKDFHRKEYVKGQEAVADEVAVTAAEKTWRGPVEFGGFRELLEPGGP